MIEINVQTKNNVLLVPSEAIFIQKGSHWAYVVKDNKADLTPVEVGISDNHGGIEILKGLNEGDLIVSEGHLRLTPGAKVNIKKPLEKEAS
jgi:multidrug efflux pump subunit AcrA (membrane-fusion protein)